MSDTETKNKENDAEDINAKSETATMNTSTSEDSEYETIEVDRRRRRTSGSRWSSLSDDLSKDIAIETNGDGQEATTDNNTSEDSLEYETMELDNGSSTRSSGSRRSSFSDDPSDNIAIKDEREDGDGQEATMSTNTSKDSLEYDTLEEDNGSSTRSSGSRRSSFSDDPSDNIAVEDKGEDGDGQEEKSVGKVTKLDVDEDKLKPQYIPKKGTFYEHDDRTMVDENNIKDNKNETNNRRDAVEAAANAAGGKKTGRNVRMEKIDKWTHDLYNEDEQKPKSTQELIDTYGYDIRNEEAPPNARRRGGWTRRGQYTMNWKEEGAYTLNNQDKFPELGSRGRMRDKSQPRIKFPSLKSKCPASRQFSPQSKPRSGERDTDRSKGEWPRRERGERERVAERGRGIKDSPPSKTSVQDRLCRQSKTTPNNRSPQVIVAEKTIGLGPKDREGEKQVGQGRGFRGTGKPRPTIEFTFSRGRGPLPPAFNRKPVLNQVDDSLKHAAEMVVQDFSRIYINNSNTNNIVEETIVPSSERRLHVRDADGGVGGVGGGSHSKRYSIQRQRTMPLPTYSLPETRLPLTYNQPETSTSPTYDHSWESYVPTPVYNEVVGPQVPMTAFLPPVPPLPAPAGSPPMQFPQISGQFEDPYEAGLYQGQGGITYYSPESQPVVPCSSPPRRVNLAIPIVPDNQQSGGGGGASGDVDTPT